MGHFQRNYITINMDLYKQMILDFSKKEEYP